VDTARWPGLGNVHRLVVMLLVAGYATLTVAWALGSPLNSGPDESQHYNKAVAAGRGELQGLRTRPARPTQLRLYWTTLTARVFVSPGVLAEREVTPCDAFRPTLSAKCPLPPPPSTRPVRSYTGSYQPFIYVPIGLVADRATNVTTGFRLARITSATMCLALIALGAAAALRVRPAERLISLAGLMVAIPPTAVFMFSVINPNSTEIAAGICFAAGLVRMMRAPRSAIAWLAVVIGGAVLGVSRSLGPFWIGFGVLFLVADAGMAGVRLLPRRATVLGGAVLVASAAACAWWEAAYQPHLSITVHATLQNLPAALREWPALLRQSVGVFGWNDTRMPVLAYIVGWAIALGVGLVAFAVGSRRERVILAAASIALILAAVIISAAVLHREGFGMSSRYMLAPAAMLPIYAAEVLRRHRERLARTGRGLIVAVVPIAGALQIVGWWSNARRYAVGSRGPIFFFGRSQWHPAYGWTPWLLLAVAGVVLLMTAALPGLKTTLISSSNHSEPPG
jgi:hypothetical protein